MSWARFWNFSVCWKDGKKKLHSLVWWCWCWTLETRDLAVNDSSTWFCNTDGVVSCYYNASYLMDSVVPCWRLMILKMWIQDKISYLRLVITKSMAKDNLGSVRVHNSTIAQTYHFISILHLDFGLQFYRCLFA